MKYRLDVWMNRNPHATYEDDDIKALVKIFKEDYGYEYERGGCAISVYVYEDGRELSIDEEYELGFYD